MDQRELQDQEPGAGRGARPVALVTGAGSGLGAAIARRFAADAYEVVLVGRRREPLAAVARELRGSAGTAWPLSADLADPAAPARILEEVAAGPGRLDVLINNAAHLANRPFAAYSTADVDQHLAVNLRAPFLLVQAALPLLRRAPAPAVVNISSAAAAMARSGQAAYGMTKAALEHLTRSLAMELSGLGIRVNGVAPGPLDTAIHASYGAGATRRRAALHAAVPLGRLGRPEEVAGWVRALADPAASWVTGAVIRVDGGRVLGRPGDV